MDFATFTTEVNAAFDKNDLDTLGFLGKSAANFAAIPDNDDATDWAYLRDYTRGAYRVLLDGKPVATKPQTAQVAAPVAKGIEQGYYTVEDAGGHVTLRFLPKKNAKIAGTMTVAYLYGSDNTSDYCRFAYYSNGRLFPFDDFKGNQRLSAAVHAVATMDDPTEAGKLFARMSGNCRRCNKLLTNPNSLDRSVGPECAKVLGLV